MFNARLDVNEGFAGLLQLSFRLILAVLLSNQVFLVFFQQTLATAMPTVDTSISCLNNCNLSFLDFIHILAQKAKL